MAIHSTSLGEALENTQGYALIAAMSRLIQAMFMTHG